MPSKGPYYSFSFGDYIAKALVGVIDPLVHTIDMPGGVRVFMAGDRTLQTSTWSGIILKKVTCCRQYEHQGKMNIVVRHQIR